MPLPTLQNRLLSMLSDLSLQQDFHQHGHALPAVCFAVQHDMGYGSTPFSSTHLDSLEIYELPVFEAAPVVSATHLDTWVKSRCVLVLFLCHAMPCHAMHCRV